MAIESGDGDYTVDFGRWDRYRNAVDGEEEEEDDEEQYEKTETFPLVVVPDEQLERLPRTREPQKRRLRTPSNQPTRSIG